MTLLVLALLAAAPSRPPGEVRPIVVAAGFGARVRAATDGEVQPVCAPLVAEHLDLCFRLRDADHERWVVPGDVGARGVAVDLSDLRAQAARVTTGLMARAHLARVAGGDDAYLQLADTTGLAAAPFLHPEELPALLGPGPLRAAAPNVDVTLVWVGDGGPRDTILSVGAREMAERQARPISAVVYTFDGRAWAPWAEAVKPGDAAGP